ncbi:MAG TPA: hypothetical protein VER12_16275 [Polyangiaceae bacterium]|nr:hypothetical protein [Polyangiaceae bacterium]
MKEPQRLSNDDHAPAELRALLRAAARARPLDPAVRERAGARVARAAVFPIAAASWLSAKTAIAALSVGFGTAVVALVALVPEPAPQIAPATRGSNASASHRTAPVARALPIAAPVAAASAASDPDSSRTSGNVGVFPNEPADAPPVGMRSATGRPSPSSESEAAPRGGELAAESALLERARSALRQAPSEALALVREHAERFPRGQLGAERALIEMDALHRLGRDQEARRLAQAWLSRSHDDLYVERVDQLLDKLSN